MQKLQLQINSDIRYRMCNFYFLQVCFARNSFSLFEKGHLQEQVLQKFKEIIYQKIEPKLPQLFKDLPNLPLV